MWTDKQFWTRLGCVAAVVWVGLIIIASQVARDFRWFPYIYRNNYDFGPAAITAFVGVCIIAVVCGGVPWIAEGRKHKAQK